MKNIPFWKPTKYVLDGPHLRASRNPDEVWPPSRLMADIIAKYYQVELPKYSKGNLLDLGCGKAPLYLIYKNHASNITCVDWDNSIHGHSHLDFTMDLNEKLKFDNDQFDTIILSDVLEHIREPKNLMSEIFRILKNEGHLLMNIPFLYWLHEEPYDYQRFTKYALINLSKSSGFEIIALNEIGGAPEVTSDILQKSTYSGRLGRRVSSTIYFLTTVFLNTKWGQKISKKSSLQFPYGYFLVLKKQ